jgi:DNA-binding transcriptional LysR family regulator
MDSRATVLRNRLIARARLRHLQVLVRVAELGSVQRAAESVDMSQPAVSHVLADLEGLLGCTLFHRQARGMRATAVGQALLPQARRMLATVDDIAELVAALNDRASGQVRVAAIAGAMAGLLVRAIPAFGHEHPDILVKLQEADVAEQSALVARGDVDLALCRAPQVLPDGWVFTPLVADRFAIVAGPQHPLAGRRRVGMQALRAATWLASPTATAARAAFDRLFEPPQPVQRQVSTRATAMLWAMLVQEPLLCLVPVTVAQQLLDAGQLVEIRHGLDLPFEPIGLLQPRTGLGDAARTLVAFLQRHVAATGPVAAARTVQAYTTRRPA